MRLFIAIDFSELKDYFLKLQQDIPKSTKLSLTNSFHLTLKFLGDVQPNSIETVKDSLRQIKFQPFSVFLNKIGVFPNENYARVVWVGLKPENKILELQKKIDDFLAKFFRKGERFNAHITLARIKDIEDTEGFIKKLKKITVDEKKIEVNDFRLIKSTLTKNGPIYEDLEIFGSPL